ncbi:MAG: ThuA domain-containing protein [Flavisolibacter sp.]
MKLRQWYLHAVMLIIISAFSFSSNKKEKKVLVFSKTNGFVHNSIPDGIAAIKKIGEQEGFIVDTTRDSTKFTKDNLKKYAAIIFLNTTGNVLGTAEEKEFENYIKKGGGFVGIHSATDTEYGWEWYGKFIGAYFLQHPEIQQAKLQIINPGHLATKALPAEWIRTDEWYNFKNLNKENNVLIRIDESSYKGGKNGTDHPVSWSNEREGGRIFYTALGHTKETYKEPLFLEHLKGGILYAIGKK